MTLIAEQTVLARAVSPLSLGKSPTKGTPCVTVTCKLKEGPDEGKLIDFVGWLTDNTKARSAEALAAFGFDGETPASVQKNDVRLVIRHESYTNDKGEEQTIARVAFVNDPSRGGARFDVLEPHEEARLMGDLKGLVFALREKKPQADSGADFSFGANAKADGKVVF